MKRLTFIISFSIFMLGSCWADESESTTPFVSFYAH